MATPAPSPATEKVILNGDLYLPPGRTRFTKGSEVSLSTAVAQALIATGAAKAAPTSASAPAPAAEEHEGEAHAETEPTHE